jgi:Ca-activated chloride channel family protein
MTFASPLWLGALALVPVAAAAYMLARRRSGRYAVRFTAVSTVRAAAGGVASSWRTHLPAALVLISVAALALALARPRVSYSSPIEEASVMLVTDHSGSMASTDVSPTRLAAAERAANAFIDKLPAAARVGAIAFSDSPDAFQAPTTDHSLARAIIDGQVAGGATATGDALALALQLLHGSDPKHPPSAIVLLSDGAANAGQNVLTVAREAARDRIPIYTVALGTPGGMLANPLDPYAPPIPVPPDPALMQAIASASGGRAFNAQTADQLSSIYRQLGTQLGSVRRTREVTAMFAVAGVVLLVGAVGAGTRWAARLP